MNIKTINTAHVTPTRWRNGGGWTRELVAWPKHDDWTIRVSVADIESDGAFSSFPGVDRWFAVIEGAGVALDVSERAPITISPASPLYEFRGEDAAHCSLVRGAVRDFNVMVRRERGRAVVREVRDASVLRGDARWVGLFVVDESVLNTGRDTRVELAPMTFVWIDNAAREQYALELSGRNVRGWWVELSLLA